MPKTPAIILVNCWIWIMKPLSYAIVNEVTKVGDKTGNILQHMGPFVNCHVQVGYRWYKMDYFPGCTYLPMENLGSKKKIGTLPR